MAIVKKNYGKIRVKKIAHANSQAHPDGKIGKSLSVCQRFFADLKKQNQDSAKWYNKGT